MLNNLVQTGYHTTKPNQTEEHLFFDERSQIAEQKTMGGQGRETAARKPRNMIGAQKRGNHSKRESVLDNLVQ